MGKWPRVRGLLPRVRIKVRVRVRVRSPPWSLNAMNAKYTDLNTSPGLLLDNLKSRVRVRIRCFVRVRVRL